MALHVPRGIYTIVVSIRLDYCRRDCATSPSWRPAMSYEENYREQPRERGHATSAGSTLALLDLRAPIAIASLVCFGPRPAQTAQGPRCG